MEYDTDYNQKCKLMGVNKKLKNQNSNLDDIIKELKLKNEKIEKELHCLKMYNNPLYHYKKGIIYQVNLKNGSCEIIDENNECYFCNEKIKINATILSKNVYFEIDKTYIPFGKFKQKVIIKEIDNIPPHQDNKKVIGNAMADKLAYDSINN